ncbi:MULTISPECIES: ATP-binding protein [unclassified Lentimicrobium]|uniref:ATP-binding protein n=1 Tax=unclassified Lentimicrobium TaxID=2677434 RepID=UPI001555B78C|nr:MULTISPECIES: ATP-binding protein [unclassified Lentimicrobium]NPD46392.1 ATP-binding protein [Lentimicrobium sp. S6]NPD83578.1 ATP-binding protein [Lentimicrobium sp. L6]
MKDLSLHILDIAHNSIRAKAKNITIKISEDVIKDRLSISIIDDGSGMSKEQVESITDPFFTTRTTRKVGLGIPLIKQRADECNGSFSIESELGKGTELDMNFQHSHLDLPELGDIAGVISGLCCSCPDIRFIFDYNNANVVFHFDTEEVLEVLDGLPINTPEVEMFIKEMIEGNLLSE